MSASKPRRSTRGSTPTISSKIERSLPLECANPLLKKNSKPHRVKNQVLHLNSENRITIARVKCPVPKGTPGHIIKRFDTNAISASSLFRAAFPTSSEEQEEAEMNWIAHLSNSKYGDTAAAGHEDDPAMKLSGTWIPAAKATILALEYGIEKFAKDLIAHEQELHPVELLEPEALDSEDLAEPPATAPSPKPKRQRVLSPTLPPPISIPPVLSVPVEGVVVEEVELIVTEEEVSVDFDAKAEEEIEGAKKIVAAVKEAALLSTVDSKKRDLSELITEEPLLETEIVEEVLIDNRGVFGKIFRSAPKPEISAREIKGAGSQIALLEKKGMSTGGKWMTGIGFAVVVGATAAVPYLLG